MNSKTAPEQVDTVPTPLHPGPLPPGIDHSWKGRMSSQNPKLGLCLHLSFCSFLWIKLRALALKCAYEQRYQAVHASLRASFVMGRLICIHRFLTFFIP